MPIKILKKTIPLRGLSISIIDVIRIVERLIQHVDEQGHSEVAQISNTNPVSSDRQKELELEREQAFRITVTIVGRHGESLFGYGTESLTSPNIPEPIDSIYISNCAAYQTVTGRNPLNNFTLHLDFSTPPLVDNNNPASAPTPNVSILTIEGDRDAWVASIHQAVMNVLEKRFNKRRIFHMAHIYDIGLAFFGFPLAIYLCWRVSEFVETNVGAHSLFLSTAAYIYVFFIALNIYRVLFGYARWAFPAVDLTSSESQSKHHRKAWFAIVLGIIGTAIYDLFS